MSVSQIEAYHKDNKNRKLNTGGADERELEEALKRSMQDMKDKDQYEKLGDDGAPSVGSVLNKGAAAQDKPKFEAFKGQGTKLVQDEDVDMRDEAAALYSEFGDDPELAMAIKMSMIEEEAKRMVVPEEPPASDPQAVTVQIRLPDNSKLLRRFNFDRHTA